MDAQDIGITASAIFEAIPSPAFVFDEDARAVLANSAARRIGAGEEKFDYLTTAGALLDCLHAAETPRGCGHSPYCSGCAIRRLIEEVMSTGEAHQRKYKMQKRSNEGENEVYLIISAAPVHLDGERRALLILEDITELTQLRDILPICANCKKIRNDEHYWEAVDTYLHEHEHMEFTHSLCPSCLKELYPQFAT